jgi:hypothetical protein
MIAKKLPAEPPSRPKTLRDEFAMAALIYQPYDELRTADAIAKECFQIADFMMIERDK